MKTNMMNIFVAAFLVMGGLSHIPLPACQAVASSQGDERRLVVVSDLELVGEIEGENISFTLAMNADVDKRRSQLALVSGDVAYIGGELPRKAELSRANSTYML